MLTPKQYRLLPQNIIKLFEQLEDEVISQMAKSMKETLELSSSTDYQLDVLQRMGYDLQQIKREIAKRTDLSVRKVNSLMLDSAYLSYDNDTKLYAIGKKILPPIEKNPILVAFINSAIQQTGGYLRNITNTTGFIDNKQFKPLDTFYQDVLNYATFQIGTGAFDHNTVLKQAVRKLGSSGIRYIDFQSGRKYHTDTAVRLAVMTGVRQITNYMSEYNMNQMGAEFVEVTAHLGARPSHQPWQGKVYSWNGDRGDYEDFETATGYGTGEGLGGFNCRHDFYCYFPGISERAYTDEQLKNLDPPPFEFEDEEYTYYQGTQKQRYFERQMRKTKREIIAFESAGLKDDVITHKVRLRRQQERYREFSELMNTRTRYERTSV